MSNCHLLEANHNPHHCMHFIYCVGLKWRSCIAAASQESNRVCHIRHYFIFIKKYLNRNFKHLIETGTSMLLIQGSFYPATIPMPILETVLDARLPRTLIPCNMYWRVLRVVAHSANAPPTQIN